jgi:hypothetical protein
MAKGGFALDPRPNGFGLISSSYHATAAFSDPLTDHLYLVMDEVDEPTDPILPNPPVPVEGDGLTIYQFDGDEEGLLTYRWRGKLNLLDRPSTLHFARARALEYDNLVARVYANGVLIDTFLVTDEELVRLPGLDSYNTYELELIGTSTARSIAAAEHPDQVP